MKKYFAIALIILAACQPDPPDELLRVQTGPGWGSIRYKVNFRDTVNLLGWMIHDTTITPGAKQFNFIHGLTSNVQTQLNAKAPTASPTFTGTVTIPSPFTLGPTSVTTTGAQINYLNTATGTSYIDDELLFDSTTDTLLTKAEARTLIAAVNGYSVSKMQFIVDTTAYAPVTGDSLFQQDSFKGKHLEIYRTLGMESGESMAKVYRNLSGVPQIYHDGYRFNSQTGTVIVKPVFSTGEHVAIEITDSTSWTDIVPASLMAQVLSGTVTGDESSVNTDEHIITMPTGVQAGELILVFFACDGYETKTLEINVVASGANWHIGDTAKYSTLVTGGVLWKIAEGEDALTITTPSPEQATFIAYRISGFNAADPVTVTNASGNSTNFDPPSNTPAHGTADYLWMVYAASDAQVVASAAPADFGNLATVTPAGTSCAASSIARREYVTSGAYNPGAFTATTEQWAAFTVIVNPD